MTDLVKWFKRKILQKILKDFSINIYLVFGFVRNFL